MLVTKLFAVQCRKKTLNRHNLYTQDIFGLKKYLLIFTHHYTAVSLSITIKFKFRFLWWVWLGL